MSKTKNAYFIIQKIQKNKFTTKIESKNNSTTSTKIIKRKQFKSTWLPEEDSQVINLVKEHPNRDWNFIASKFNSLSLISNKKSPKQIRERFTNHLAPNVNKNDWTTEEEKILLTKHMIFGNKWCRISTYLPGRSDNCVKNHFYAMLRKYIRKVLRNLIKDKVLIKFGLTNIDVNADSIYKLIKRNKISIKNLNQEMILDLILSNFTKKDNILSLPDFNFNNDPLLSINSNMDDEMKLATFNNDNNLNNNDDILNNSLNFYPFQSDNNFLSEFFNNEKTSNDKLKEDEQERISSLSDLLNSYVNFESIES